MMTGSVRRMSVHAWSPAPEMKRSPPINFAAAGSAVRCESRISRNSNVSKATGSQVMSGRT